LARALAQRLGQPLSAAGLRQLERQQQALAAAQRAALAQRQCVQPVAKVRGALVHRRQEAR
jgi:hypothetical protein